jgi:hypothetical protein
MSQSDHYILTKRAEFSITSIDVCALLAGILSFALCLLLWEGNRAIVHNIIKEDGIVENFSAFFWLQASIICFYRIGVNSQNNKILLWFWAIFCLLCFGEEISWGQRIFMYSVQAVQHVSDQHEFNIHNLTILSTKLGMSRYLMHEGKINWLGLLNAQNLFYLGFLTYFLFIPLLVQSKRLSFLKNKFNYKVPSFYFLISIWPTIILTFILALSPTMVRIRSMIETREMFMAFVVLFYVSFYLYQGS